MLRRMANNMNERFVSVCNRLCKPNTGKEDGNRRAYYESYHPWTLFLLLSDSGIIMEIFSYHHHHNNIFKACGP
jgi:hypothetical protein